MRSAAISSNPGAHSLPTPRQVLNQNDVPCCVSCALGTAMEIIHPNSPPLAPLFHYYLTRFERRGATPQGFLFLSDALSVLEGQGICRLTLHPHPFSLTEVERRPSAAALADGRLQSLAARPLLFLPRRRSLLVGSRAVSIREELRRGHPVILAFRLPVGYRDFIHLRKEWSDPQVVAESGLGHCVVVIGYDDARFALRIQDSQGTGFANGGRWWMDYKVVDSSFVQEAWSLTP